MFEIMRVSCIRIQYESQCEKRALMSNAKSRGRAKPVLQQSLMNAFSVNHIRSLFII